MKFIFDIDGTICFKGKPLTEGIIQALDVCHARGHEVIFASARPIRDLLPVLPSHMHHYSMIGGNGAFVAKEGKVIEVKPFDALTMNAIRSLIEEYDLAYLIDSHWDYAYTGSENHPISQNIDPNRLAANVSINCIGEMVKVVLFPDGNAERLVRILNGLPVRMYEHHQEEIIDISPLGIDKWKGLQKLGIGEGAFIAFGNDANDVPMFLHAKEGICIGEHESLRSVASMCLHNNEQSIIDKIIELSEVYA
ncbi:HAD-IIB family hydrolase [Bacillus gaemokensis]|uniref:HAD family hydrolase n=1 Tax=Bacillus gaemokensis TaxID=574375 RepID=A0A073K5G1_9BACI|nr:HAD-IIB family hydrolase [Bacillus gaemokensis]KEK21707.1 HAD family hydrolase [Bacillus gaemokensis]KYG38476.1 HAD family hydrolase [Bacillus gaemokensis]